MIWVLTAAGLAGRCGRRAGISLASARAAAHPGPGPSAPALSAAPRKPGQGAPRRVPLVAVPRVRGSLVAAVGLAVVACLLVPPAAHAADATDILLDDAGPGFQRGSDQQGSLSSTTRTFIHPHGQLQLQAIPVTDGVSTRQLFALLEQVDVGIPGVATVDVPGLPLARWMGQEGVAPEQSSVLFVAFAARSAVFSALLTTDDVKALPPVATLLDVATRQIARAGGAPEGADRAGRPRRPRPHPAPAR